MPAMDIKLEGDGCWPDLANKPLTWLGEGSPPIQIACLSGGMVGGNPSVAIRIDLPDGSVVVAETSVRLFLLAAHAIERRYGPEIRG